MFHMVSHVSNIKGENSVESNRAWTLICNREYLEKKKPNKKSETGITAYFSQVKNASPLMEVKPSQYNIGNKFASTPFYCNGT